MTIAITLPATPTKLRDGTWGARTKAQARVGDLLEITTSSGKKWKARVERIIWTGNGVAICTTSSDRARRSSGGCHTDGNCSSMCSPRSCPCADGAWFSCC